MTSTNGFAEPAPDDALLTHSFPDKTRPGSSRPGGNPRDSGQWAVVLTSLIFGAVHWAQWPAPVALCVLGLVIGTVYHRTGSLIAAVCMHASFNAFSTTAMLVGALYGQLVEAKKVPVARAETVASTQFVYSMTPVTICLSRFQ
jgi:hypothetical protein